LAADFYKAPDNNPHEGVWEYWERYDLKGEKGSRYIYAPRRWFENGEWGKNVNKAYQPLVGRSGLFFKFARLADDGGLSPASSPEALDTDKNAQSAYDWADQMGVLGLTSREWQGWFYFDTRGGKEDTVVRFAEEAWAANAVLRLYEAATREEGGPDIETMLEIMKHGGVSPRSQKFNTHTPEMAREWALLTAAQWTQERVARYCHPALYRRPGQNHFIQGSGFSNLLGALWLEMFWVLLSDKTRRCRDPECNHIVPFEPTPAREWSNREQDVRATGYATRADKVYCGRTCANRHYYKTTIKPRRQATKD
jgi:hypothetical protein